MKKLIAVLILLVAIINFNHIKNFVDDGIANYLSKFNETMDLNCDIYECKSKQVVYNSKINTGKTTLIEKVKKNVKKDFIDPEYLYIQ